jgi:DNA (cytosine-5)-methyltransferase 1
MKPRLLDLFSGAGGAARGYQMAGFHVTGIDNRPQPRYAGDAFVMADALEYVAEHGHEYDAIHASPPCQVHSALKSLYGADYQERHQDLIPATRAALIGSGKPYVIENVPGAPLINPVVLCGTMFGLRVYRHRQFESSVFMLMPIHAPHHDQVKGVGRGVSPKGYISVTGTGGFGIPDGFRYACDAMGIDWMSRAEMSQAIPPAYTAWIGRQLLEES